jgi:4-hydroxy-tetrahydrodipicolinate reductase
VTAKQGSNVSYRVIQWSTGNVGKLALRGIINHPDLELVGLWVHSPDKVGRDAGELVGLAPTGIKATSDVEALLALEPDCVSYTATGDLRPSEAIDDMCRILASGANVVATSVVPLVFPPAADPSIVARIQEACDKGGTACFTSGIDPGFANDTLPLVLTGLCERIEQVRVMEIVNYATYNQPQVLFETMGFAKPLDHQPILLIPGILTLAWGGVVKQIAAGLGVEIEEIRETHVKVPAPEAFDIPPGHVPAGTMAGLRFEVQGIVNGRPAIVLEHVTRLRDDIAPDWPKPLRGSGCYRVVIEGSPATTCELLMHGDDGDHNTGNLVATALRILNAIPAVCAAKPGLLSALDLPLVTGRHLLR